MTDYTPTTEEVREYVSIGGEYRPWDAPDSSKEKAREAAFDRWLADRDRKIAAEALRDAANDTHRMWCQEDGPSDWLDARADRIEQGGES